MFNRLRSMDVREVLHRLSGLAGRPFEKAAIAAGWTPLPACPVKPRMSLFMPPEDWLAAWERQYSLERERLDQALQGKIGFFGHAPLDVGVPVNWHRDPLTGIEAPRSFGKELNYRDERLVGNIKVLWELGRHQHLIPFAAAYACTGEPRYRKVVVSQIESWIDDNPYGRGIHWCSALESALRLISWAVVHSLLALRDGDSGLFSAGVDPGRLGRAIYQQAWFVRHFLSRYSSANNHLIGELTGLWVACRVFDMGETGERWAAAAQRELECETILQVHGDGVSREQAFYYHLWVMEYFLLAWIVGLRAKRAFSEAVFQRVLTMAGFLRAVTPVGGLPPQIGDADDGFVTRFSLDWPKDPYRDALAAVETLSEARVVASPLPQKAFWYGLCTGQNMQAPDRGPSGDDPYPRFFQEGGYAILGGGGLHLVFDGGPLGYPSIAAHGHADALNICLALDGVWWIVDPGTYAYHGERGWRDYFRGTAAHNTLQIDGRNQSEIGGPFLWLRHARARLVGGGSESQGVQWAAGEHDGYKRLGAVHTRRVELDKTASRVTLSDEVQGKGAHELAMHFHFAPDVQVRPGPYSGTWLATKSGTAREMILTVNDAWQWHVFHGCDTPRLGWFSPALGLKVPACTLRGVWRGTLPVGMVTNITVN